MRMLKYGLVMVMLAGLILASKAGTQTALDWDMTTDSLLDEVNITDEPASDLGGFHFIDDKTEFTSTSLGRVIQTTDGGLTWKLAYDGAANGGNRNYFFLGASTWFSEPSIDGKLWGRTVDAGKRWEFFHNLSCPNIAPSFMSADVGWGTSDFSICATKDGGKTWSVVAEHPAGAKYVGAIFMLDNTHGWVSGDHQILATTDGTHWVPWSFDSSMGAAEIHFFDQNNGFAKAHGRSDGQDMQTILYSKDGGQHWDRTNWNLPGVTGLPRVLDIAIRGAREIWVVGWFLKANSPRQRGPLATFDYILFHSRDGGASFQPTGKLPDDAGQPKSLAVAAQQCKPVLLMLGSNGALWRSFLRAN